MRVWIGAVALLSGCEADFARVELDCRAETGAIGPETGASVAAALLGPTCAGTLGAAIGLDWGSFGFEPDQLAESQVGTYVVLGLLSVIDAPATSFETLKADADIPSVALEGMLDLETAGRMEDDTPSNEAWFEWIQTAVTEVVYLPDGGGAAARYDDATGELSVYDEFVGGDLTNAWPLPYAGAALIHEATHRLSSHTECPDGSGAHCDATPNGAYGVQVWWLSRWQRLGDVARDGDTCRDIDDIKVVICLSMIVDASGWAPCERACD